MQQYYNIVAFFILIYLTGAMDVNYDGLSPQPRILRYSKLFLELNHIVQLISLVLINTNITQGDTL